ncbi:acetate--CoA ligase family protein [Paraburkholderia sp. HP33-1]|uniref:acetate--CoA ligase family protein n=1 Tax=Paraburkholderia sp. HP33-1 TaxID=2883243 RepID=UPI001F213558|nr:acetate--CoA ligase family protein [Paraburkholderia sp. HP33-1]
MSNSVAGRAPLDRLFSPRSIAMIGASNAAGRIGALMFANLARFYKGRLYPIHPREAEIQGVRAYASVADVPDQIDMAVIAVSAESAVGVLEEVAAAGIAGAVVVTSGFAEAGDAGKALQARLIEVAERTGVRLIGPNCIGYLNVAEAVAANFALLPGQPLPVPGRVALISQSGGFGSYLMSKGLDAGLQLGWFVSTGNEADLNLSQVLRYLVERPEVGVLLMFSETLRDPEIFIEAVERAYALGKPVVLLKAGRSDEAARAAMSHTASIVGSADVLDAVCSQYGVLVAETMEEMLDYGLIFQDGRRPAGSRVGIVTTSGGAGVLLSDEAARAGLSLPELPRDEQERLIAVLPQPFYGNVSNPIDTTAQITAKPGATRSLYAELSGSESLDMLTTVTWASTSPAAAPAMQELIDFYKGTGKPVAVLSTALIPMLRDAGVPTYTDPRRVMRALAALAQVAQREPLAHSARRAQDAARADRARKHLEIPLQERVLMEHQGKRLFAEYGIPVTRERLVHSADAAIDAALQLGGKVALKVMSYALPHKSDVGALRLGLSSADEIRDAFESMMSEVKQRAPRAAIEGVLVQEMVPARMELTCGVQRDPVFGPMVAVGLGGVLIEQIAETALLRPPFDTATALRAIRGLLGGRLVKGRRGLSEQEQVQIAEVMVGVGNLALDLPEVAEVDINPIRVGDARAVAVAADALVVLARDGAADANTH